jgi:hypothetical protein
LASLKPRGANLRALLALSAEPAGFTPPLGCRMGASRLLQSAPPLPPIRPARSPSWFRAGCASSLTRRTPSTRKPRSASGRTRSRSPPRKALRAARRSSGAPSSAARISHTRCSICRRRLSASSGSASSSCSRLRSSASSLRKRSSRRFTSSMSTFPSSIASRRRSLAPAIWASRSRSFSGSSLLRVCRISVSAVCTA